MLIRGSEISFRTNEFLAATHLLNGGEVEDHQLNHQSGFQRRVKTYPNMICQEEEHARKDQAAQ